MILYTAVHGAQVAFRNEYAVPFLWVEEKTRGKSLVLCSVDVTDKLVSKVCAAGSRQHPTAHHASDAGRSV